MSGCDAASTFTVKDSMLLQYWPSMGLAEEKIVQVGAETITTVVVTPASQRGKLFRYTPAGARLDVEDVAGNRRQSLKKC